MQLWFAHGSETTLREQLVTQVILGILSGDLAPEQRLPSTRELARRFRLHANTVSAGYRQLEREGWVEFRRGSGIYVRDSKPEKSHSMGLTLDQQIARLFSSARKGGVPLATLRSRLRHFLELQPPDHFIVVEPDPELRRILAHEIQPAVTLPVRSCGTDDLAPVIDGAIAVSLPNKEKIIRDLLPNGTELLVLPVRSVPGSLAGWLPARANALIAIASRWPGFLKLARTMLSAAGFPADGLLFRDARKANWQRGLKETAAVVCDSVTAAEVPKTCRAIVFPLLSQSALSELRQYEQFICDPLT